MSAPLRPDTTPALHTSGPWRVLDFSTGTKGFIAVVAHADRHVADVFPFGQRVAGTELAEHQANARLIAAAPETTAELGRLWDQIVAAEFDNIEDDEDLVLVTITAPQARAIRAALAKARGASQ